MMEEGTKDGDLVERYISGDKSSLAILVKRWHRIFCEKAYWILRDKDMSKDVAQESWIIIIDKLHTLQKVDSFKSWALRIVYSKAIDAHKRRRKENLIDASEQNNYEEPAEKEDEKILKQKLLLAIQNLSKEKQDVIRLFYVEGYSLKEISSFLQTPIGTIKSRLFKAREKLKSIIKSNDYEK